MSIYSFITGFYSSLYSNNIILNKLLSPIRYICRFFANKILNKLFQCKSVVLKNKTYSGNKRIIVSLTSFPARIDDVWLVIQGLLHQTVLPNKIVLWLSKEQFCEKTIPDSLSRLENDIFEIRLVEGDFKSHKKYVYAFNEFPNDYVVLLDDDIFYHSKLIETLLLSATQNPDKVICCYGSLLTYGNKGNLLPFEKRLHIEGKSNNQNFFFGSGGGTLFEPNKLYKDCCLDNLFMKLTPKADDIWLNAMVRLAKLETIKIDTGILLTIEIKNNVSLCTTNLGENFNDVQFDSVIKWYIKTLGINPFKRR